MGTYEYIYGAGFVIPNLPLDVIQQNFRYYQQRQLQMYRAEFYPLWAFDAPKAYIIRKMLWDPDQDVRTLLRQFCDRTFGEAGPIMYRFYEHTSCWRNSDAKEGEWTPMWGKVWPFREPLQFSRTPGDFHRTLFECLNQARKCKLSVPQRERIGMIEAFTEFSATYFEMWQLKERVLGGTLNEGDSQHARELRKAGSEIIDGFEDHPEWFLGSSVKADGFYLREWPVSELEQQMNTVESTAAYLAVGQNRSLVPSRNGGVQLTPLRREEHSWYKAWQSQPLALDERMVGGFTFHNRTNQSIRNEDDNRYDGEMKFQWLHANARNLGHKQEGRYLATVSLKGREGLLKLELVSNSRYSETGKTVHAESFWKFGEELSTRTLRAVITTKRLSDDGVSPTVQLRLIWKPEHGDSELSGSASMLETVAE